MIQIIVTKFLSFICKIFGKNGSVFPASVTYHWNPLVLSKIKYPKLVIGVTGSSGKGSTISLINHILKNAGYDVCYNASGSNAIRGITTTILTNSTIFGKFKHDVLLLELDERHIKMMNCNPFTHIVITNITRDQPARNGEPDEVFNDLMAPITNTTHLIINADDPIVSTAKLSHLGEITTYGIAQTKDSIIKPLLNSLDHAYCPICHRKLTYSYYHYGHLGNYECPNHDFGRGNVDYEGKNLNLEQQTIYINDDAINLNKNILYAAYYTVAAYALCSVIGVPKEKIIENLNKNILTPKRGSSLRINNREITMLESKNENALSYHQSIKYIIDEPGNKTVILGFDNVSRRYSHNDLSWLYDTPFELLNNSSVTKILCIGRFRYDVQTRLKYAGIPDDKLILIDDLKTLLPTLKEKTEGHIYTMVCFDMTNNIKTLLKGELK